jgi:phospholipase C
MGTKSRYEENRTTHASDFLAGNSDKVYLAKITGTVVVGIYPHGIAITPDGKKAYVANTGPNTGPGGSYVVSVVDVASQTVTGTVNVGEAPEVVTVSPDGSLVFVTCADGVYAITTSGGRVRRAPERLG